MTCSNCDNLQFHLDQQAAEIAALKAQIESWKREEVLRDEREAGKDAALAAAESERIEWVQRGERAEERCKELEAQVERLVAAGDRLADELYLNRKGGDLRRAWTAAKEGE